jgi:hypothetical protein
VQRIVRHVRDAGEEDNRHVLTHHGSGLEQAFQLGTQTIDARREDGLHRMRHLDRCRGLRKPIRARLAHQDTQFDKSPHALFEEERVALRPRDKKGPEGPSGWVGSEESP